MVPKVKNIIEIIEGFAPEKSAEEWDNSGVQIGDLNAEVKRIGVALDPVLSSVSRSIDMGADLLVTHHPLIFPSISTIEIDRGTGKIIRLAIDNSLTIYSAHTNFDRSPRGTNLVLAKTLGLTEISPIPRTEDSTSKDDFSVVVGRLAEPVSLHDFAAAVKVYLNAPCVRLVGDENAKVAKAGVCGGSGGDFIQRVAEAGADAFVTGEVKYHDALLVKDMVGNGIYSMGLIEAGHFHTEEVAISQLAQIISEESSKKEFEIDLFVIGGEDPFSYI